jgi:ribosomal RNA-processing protein 12
MERLVRRFGFERIWGLTPVAHQKLLTNIRKRRERLKRQKQQGGATEDAAEPEYDGDKFDSMTNISMITKAGAAGIRASSKFESALNDSDSELDDSDEDEIPADSILHDLANVENDDEIETILSRKLSLATSLSRSAPSKKRAVREESSDDENVRLDDDGKMMISEDDTEEEDDDEDDRDVPVAGKKQVRFASEAKPLQKRAKKQRGDAKRREDKFEPFSYLPMTRATKKNSSQAKAKAGVGASGKKTPKYYMKRA